MKTYILRAVKYLLSLVLLYLAAITIFSLTGLSILTPQESIEVMFGTSRGVIMVVIVLVLSLLYPSFGFIKRSVSGSIAKNREDIISSCAACGLRLKSESESEMIFEGDSVQRRISMLFDKTIICQAGDKLIVEGTRRNVAYVTYSLSGKIESSINED